MNNFKPYNQNQGIFRPIIPDHLLDEDHPARIIDKVVENLNLERIYRYYSSEGNEAYHPKMMLKVLFFSYYKKKHSCRIMFDALDQRADFIFLSDGQVPCYSTINNFRKRHIKELPDLFAQIVMLCDKLGLIGFEDLAIDGEKIQANASLYKSKNKK